MIVEAPSHTLNFKNTFCDQFKCSPAKFEKKLFREAIHPDLRPIALLIKCFRPGFFKKDFESIRKIGATSNRREFLTIVNALQFDPRFNGGFLRGFMRIRISVQRLEAIAEQIF